MAPLGFNWFLGCQLATPALSRAASSMTVQLALAAGYGAVASALQPPGLVNLTVYRVSPLAYPGLLNMDTVSLPQMRAFYRVQMPCYANLDF